MASNVLVCSGGSGNAVRFNGGDLPVTLTPFSSVSSGQLVLTVNGGPADNPQLLGDAGELNCVVIASGSLVAQLVFVVDETNLVQLIKSDGTEPLLCTPVLKSAL